MRTTAGCITELGRYTCQNHLSHDLQMKAHHHLSVNLAAAFAISLAVQAQELSLLPYEQKMDVVYGETHGTGLFMDVFTSKGKSNGLAIIDVVSGAWHSDRGKIWGHTSAVFGKISRKEKSSICNTRLFY